MISYELARQLKDAGFPEKEVFEAVAYSGEPVYFPTLSELIEVCGEEFRELTKLGRMKWMAENPNGDKDGFGQTPEEAVAKLYLTLNSPKKNPTVLKEGEIAKLSKEE